MVALAGNYKIPDTKNCKLLKNDEQRNKKFYLGINISPFMRKWSCNTYYSTQKWNGLHLV